MGMVLPATAEHLGKLYCKRNGQQSYLKKGESVTYTIKTGLLSREDAAEMQERIKALGF